MSKVEPTKAKPRAIIDPTKLDNVIRAQQGNNDWLQRQIDLIVDAHNALVDDMADLKDIIENNLDITTRTENDVPDIDGEGA